MPTRQRGSSNRASSSKQSGLAIMPAAGAMPDAAAPAGGASPAGKGAGGRKQRIAISAYLRAAERGFTPGHELEDWLAAERELEASEVGLASPRQ